MKRIIIKLINDPEVLVLTDDVTIETDEYIKELSNLFQSEKVLFLKTTHENILIKPSTIQYIKVFDVQKRGKKKQTEVDGISQDEIDNTIVDEEIIDGE